MQPEKIVYVVDDDADIRDSISTLLLSAGYATESFDSGAVFLKRGGAERTGCVIADIRMPDIDGLELQEELTRRKSGLAVIIITGHADVPVAVRAMKAGAIDFLEKPFEDQSLLDSVQRAFDAIERSGSRLTISAKAMERIALLTEREKQVLEKIVEGYANKVIAYHLSISPRTVELHRARVMDKMEAHSVAELVRMSLPILESQRSSGQPR